MLPALSTSSTPASGDPIRRALTEASRATGIPFDYLLRTAQRESNLDPTARAQTSTATGLFQFLDQTWFGIVREAGPQHGLAAEAGQIERRADGRFTVADPAERQRILNLRLDPTLNAVMAGEFTRRNGSELSQVLGREPSQGELYIAHFLGAGGASRFLTEANRTPDAIAAAQFPDAARANRPIFYGRDGRALSFSEVRDRLMARHDASTAVAIVPPTNPPTVTEAALAAGAQARAVPAAPVNTGPVFHSLFRGEARQPVAPVVAALWTPRPVAVQPAGVVREPFYPSANRRVALAPAETSQQVASDVPPEAVPLAPVAAAMQSPALGAIARATTPAASREPPPPPVAPPAPEAARLSVRIDVPAATTTLAATAAAGAPLPLVPVTSDAPLDLLAFARRGTP
jgi:hypothetical protein